jgi:branched-chain amino acid transport system permease protein
MLVMLLGCLIDRLAFFPIRTAPALSLMISALAMSIILQQIATIIWGTEARTIPTPLPGVIRTTYFAITYLQLAILLSLAIAALAVWMILYHSRLGLAIRATAQNRDAAALMGIRMNVVRTSTFAISAALGAIAGALLGATFPIYPTMGSIPVLKAFVVLVLGGIGSFWGAILGGLFLGTSEVFVAGYISSQLQDIGTFLLLTMVLLVRPQGLFGRVNMER